MAGEQSFAIEGTGECTPVEPLNYGFMPVEDFYNYAEGDAAGEDAHFVFRAFPSGVDCADARRCLELVGDEVAPELR